MLAMGSLAQCSRIGYHCVGRRRRHGRSKARTPGLLVRPAPKGRRIFFVIGYCSWFAGGGRGNALEAAQIAGGGGAVGKEMNYSELLFLSRPFCPH